MSKIKDVHLHLVVDTKLLKEIERWRRRQKFAASRSEIVRRLIMAGLESAKSEVAA
jgi:hypothetical protein